MIRNFGLAVLLVLAPMAAPAFAQSADPAPAAATAEADAALTTESTVGALLANPATHAVLERHLPDVVASPQISMASAMTLSSLAAYIPTLTPEKLAEIDADLAAAQAH